MQRFRLIIAVIFALFILGSCSLESRVTRANEKYLKRAPFDAVIIPGYPYREEKNRILFHVRMHFAKELYDRGIVKNIIFSGAAVQNPFVEGKIMKIIADSLGIPGAHTFVEDKARHSNQNTLYGTRMARQMGFKKIVVATDPFQFAYMTMLVKLFTPGTAIISFSPSQMEEYNRPLPEVDTTDAYLQNFSYGKR